ncbi:MAG: hypothetical protein ACRDI2_10430 [Chloroflexota bacterium]
MPDVLTILLTYIPPAWALALVLAALNVFVFHTAFAQEGRSPLHLAPFGLVGFSAGNLIAVLAGSALPALGDVHVIEASVCAWLALSLANARKAT